VIHVLDASRSVTVVSSLLGGNKDQFVEDILEEYEEMREDYYAGLEDRYFLTFEQAKAQRKVIDFDKVPPAPVPKKTGITVIDSVKVADIVPYIDWNPFFQTWELRGRYPNRGYPKIFNDEAVGFEAKKLFNDATEMMNKIIADGSMTLKGVVGLFAANRSEDGEDVHIYETEEDREAERFGNILSSSTGRDRNGRPFLSQADFAPQGTRPPRHVRCVSFGTDVCDKHEEDKTTIPRSWRRLADRFVEAFAEYLHRQIRVDMWGYAPDEKLDEADLLKIKYDGIRPAPGYPSQPDHTEKSTMWNLIKAHELAGIELSESLSMMPASSVSALVFAHPQAEYFAVGQVSKDQVESYTARKKMELEVMERWLSPILSYERD
jgi:5-methyltetrahydrofolate--homocysteine methyltransferase